MIIGRDRYGSPIIFMFAVKFPKKEEKRKNMRLHFLKYMDNLVKNEYYIFYFHNGIKGNKCGPIKHIKILYDELPLKYW